MFYYNMLFKIAIARSFSLGYDGGYTYTLYLKDNKKIKASPAMESSSFKMQAKPLFDNSISQTDTAVNTYFMQNSEKNAQTPKETVPEGAKPKIKNVSDLEALDEVKADDLLTKLEKAEKENRDLRALNAGLRAELREHENWKVNPARIEKVVRNVIKEYA